MPTSSLQQFPPPGAGLLMHVGDVLAVRLALPDGREGEAVLRTNIGHAAIGRRERIEYVEHDRPPAAGDWQDLPMRRATDREFTVKVPLTEEGCFEAKACFLPRGSVSPVWPAGDNLSVKVEPAYNVCANAVYTAFVRLFGGRGWSAARAEGAAVRRLDADGYTVIPPSGTFRDLIRRLDLIFGRMAFRWLQLLPVHPVPTTHARMGRFGSPFAGLDFMAVDPALAEFDRRATPLDQFRELIDAVHARGGRLLMDIPANHTGWASTLQNHHPEWFKKNHDHSFHSPGAWGVTWEDLVELDYRHAGLRRFMAEVFRFWCAQGVDGFRCDAGYMIPHDAWTYIVASTRQEYPETLFLLEGLGGKIEVTARLLADANLNWAYSELFQTEDRAAFEHYLPRALALSGRVGPLIHFAETHDNARLAARGPAYARLRTALAALLSHHGAFGISNGVEWFADAKIDVHDATPLRWDARPNQVARIRRLNGLLAAHPAFGPGQMPRLVTAGDGPVLAAVRGVGADRLLVLANLDPDAPRSVRWRVEDFAPSDDWIDGLTGRSPTMRFDPVGGVADLEPCAVCCLGRRKGVRAALRHRPGTVAPRVARQMLQATALRLRRTMTGRMTLGDDESPDALAAALARDPETFLQRWTSGGAPPPVCTWQWPADARRRVMLPSGWILRICAPHPFRAALRDGSNRRLCGADSWPIAGVHTAFLCPAWPSRSAHVPLTLDLAVPSMDHGAVRTTAPVLGLTRGVAPTLRTRIGGAEARREAPCALLTNGRGAMAQVRARWGEIRSQYDALLSANLDESVPVDRTVVWTRCRAWVRFQGYSQSVDAGNLTAFEADPGGSRVSWRFQMPAGMGRRVALTFSLRMTRGRNRVVLNMTREPLQGDFDVQPVQIVLRPDIEWRGFHEKTKAYQGGETRWPASVDAAPDGFHFHPFRPGLRMRVDVGRFHPEAQWQYMVAHPDDAERGMDGASDLFSPGYFVVALRAGQRAHLEAEIAAPAVAAEEAATVRLDQPGMPLWHGLTETLNNFVVRRDALHTVIAGYPWFLDWGRDTLIVLRGLIAAGRNDLALDILREFGRFERGGTLPNMIRGNDDGNRDTSDAPLWYLRAARDLVGILGEGTVLNADCGGRPLSDVAHSILAGYCAGTANGIRVDPDSALVFSPSHFTWMDTQYPAATPRQGYPVEIQALWMDALRFGAYLEDAPRWAGLAAQAGASFARFFCGSQTPWLCDCLRAAPGQPAARAAADDALRCNAVLALALGAVQDAKRARQALAACEPLLVPGAIRSLADRPVRMPLDIRHEGRQLGDPHAPYRGRYAGSEDWERKPAYHNGTAWTWVLPSYVEAFWDLHGPGDDVRDTALALLGSVADCVNRGCLTQVPEILDGDVPHVQRGCGAQAWGVSESLRVWRKITAEPDATPLRTSEAPGA